MDKKILGLLGAASALAVAAGCPAVAAPSDDTELRPAQSFAELLEPIPNAVETLAAVEDQAPVATAKPAGEQFAEHHHHHHHYVHHHYHHHHHVVRRIIRRLERHD